MADSDARRIVAERMAEAAAAFLDSLSPDERATANPPFEGDERCRWYYTPTWQAGIPLGRLGPVEQQLLHRVVRTGTSMPGYVTAATIMSLENILDATANFAPGAYSGAEGPSRGRDPQMYFLAIFGDPRGSDPWSWRFGGHHVSLNYTIDGGRVVSPTPTFFGANPAESPASGTGSLRPLAREEDLARELVHSLDEQQRARVIISPAAPFDIVQSNRPALEDGALPLPIWQVFSSDPPERLVEALTRMGGQIEESQGTTDADREAHRYHASRPAGIPSGDLNAAQQDLFTALLHQYVDRLPDELAELEWQAIEAAGIGDHAFAWAGGLERRQPHYYRIQGPRFLVELDNTQNGANHVHTVWRSAEGDFGRDALANHYRQSHA
jgi:hypothetical protein